MCSSRRRAQADGNRVELGRGEELLISCASDQIIIMPLDKQHLYVTCLGMKPIAPLVPPTYPAPHLPSPTLSVTPTPPATGTPLTPPTEDATNTPVMPTPDIMTLWGRK